MSDKKDVNPRPKKPADSEPVLMATAPDVLQQRRGQDKYGRVKRDG